jgi:hypothetical protein
MARLCRRQNPSRHPFPRRTLITAKAPSPLARSGRTQPALTRSSLSVKAPALLSPSSHFTSLCRLRFTMAGSKLSNLAAFNPRSKVQRCGAHHYLNAGARDLSVQYSGCAPVKSERITMAPGSRVQTKFHAMRLTERRSASIKPALKTRVQPFRHRPQYPVALASRLFQPCPVDHANLPARVIDRTHPLQ